VSLPGSTPRAEIRESIVFRGRVQGVGFRATAERIATPLGLAGWVRNEPDGSVACEVQGAPTLVAAFLDELGAAMSGKIESSERRPVPPDREPTRFRVDRGSLGR
jgi:acylphosphatase